VSRSPDIRVTLGRCDDMRAEVFVGLEGGEERGVVEGTITGPHRGRDVTLPSTTRLVPLPAATGATAVSRAILTEPAFWTPDLPNLYRFEATSRDAAEGAAAAFDGSIGLRRLGVRGRSFWLDGRRWVPRAIAADLTAADAREAGVGLLVTSPSEQLLAATDEIGVAVVAVLGNGEVSPARVASLARHPSAMLAIMMEPPADEDTLADLHRRAGTLQLGLAVEGITPPPRLPDGIDFLAVVLGDAAVPHVGWRTRPQRPLVAWRRGTAAARRDCDLLQRDLARWGVSTPSAEPLWDWAGYLVEASDRRDRLGA
jgi:hypothetical protein